MDEATRNVDPVCYFSLPNTQLKNNDQLLMPEPAYYERELLIVNGAEFPTNAAAAATGAAEPPQPPLRLQGRRVLPRGLQAQGRLGARRLAREASRPRSTRSPTA